MTTQKIDAVFQDGIFRPVELTGLTIKEGQRVKIVVEMEELPHVLQLATNVYADLSDKEIDEIEQIALSRHDFFGAKAR